MTKTEAHAEGLENAIRDAYDTHCRGKCNGIKFCSFCEAEQRGYIRGASDERGIWLLGGISKDKLLFDAYEKGKEQGRAEGIDDLERRFENAYYLECGTKLRLIDTDPTIQRIFKEAKEAAARRDGK
mgnify:CR=1 FL=1